jgi:DNA-binding protein H-NS
MEDLHAQLTILNSERQKHVEALASVDAEISKIRNKLRKNELALLRQRATEFGFTAEDVFGGKDPVSTKPAAKSAKSKVVNFADGNGNTWSGGRGVKPKWVTAIINAGGDMEKYRVSPAPEAATNNG